MSCLQWADAGSLSLLRLLLNQESTPILLIGGYRDNEVDPSHPLSKLLDDVRTNQPSQLIEVVLKPLAVPHVVELLVDSFRCTEAAALPFAQLLVAKTQGTYPQRDMLPVPV
jgi:predicted ATPase